MWPLLLLVIATLALAQQRPVLDRNAWLSPNNFYLQWTNDSTYITFRATARTQGWLGLGFSYNGGMQNADMVIFWMGNNGQGQLSHRQGPANGNGYPPVNPQQDYQLMESGRNQSWMWAEFRRPLQGCDPNLYQLTGGTTKVIWAIGSDVPQNDQNIQRHTQRGSQSLLLLVTQSDTGIEQIRATARHFDLSPGRVQVPAGEQTVYWCQVVELPRQPVQYLIASEMIIQPPSNGKYVHHMLVYSCAGDVSAYVGKGSPCFTDDTVQFDPRLDKCSSIIAAWAVGGNAFVYPPNVAYPFFEPDQRFIMIEMHYDNHDNDPGVVDMSFMRLYLQPQPRPILSEKFSIQQTPTPAFFVVPPRVSNFTMYVYCPASCLSRWNKPKTVFSALLHTHLLGRAVRTRVIRRGVEQPSEFIDEHYDFNYQNNIIAQKPLVINPGDDLILECVYDSSSQSRPTYGGLGTHQEMCLSIMDIYPKGARSSESCSGLLSPDEFLGLFNLSTSNIVSNGAASDTLANFNMNLTTSRGPTTYIDYMNNINWTPQLVRRIQNFVQNSGRPIQCDINPPGVNAQELTSNQTMMMVDPVRVTQPWRPAQLQCPRNSG